MNLVALAAVGTLAMASCVSQAGAREAEPGLGDLASSTTTTTTGVPVQREAVIFVAGSLEYRDIDGSYQVRIEWSHRISHGNLDLTVDAVVELEIDPTGLPIPESTGSDDTTSESVDAVFEVSGEVRYQTGMMACESTRSDQDCGVVGLTDAALHGSATLTGSTLDVSVDWATFGRDQVPARTAIVIGRWPASGTYSATWGRVELYEIADALEAAGVIGRTFSVDVHKPKIRRLTGISTFGRGDGVLELLPAS